MLIDHDSSKMLNEKHNRKKQGILGRKRKCTTKPSKDLMEHKNIIKECKFIQIPKAKV